MSKEAEAHASWRRCMLWHKSLVLAAGVFIWGAHVQSEDCNGNGVDDALDVAPGRLELERENVWAVGVNPVHLVSGDWNGDGREDLATVNSSSPNVSVLMNRGDGALDEPTHYRIGGQYWGAHAGFLASDLNGDGSLDLAAASSIGVYVLLNAGDGTFSEADGYDYENGVESIPGSLAASDLNGDGRLDLAVTGRFYDDTGRGPSLYILLNRGDGTFEEPVPCEVDGVSILSLVVSDLNGDGTGDLAVRGRTCEGAECVDAAALFVLLNRGDGTFEDAVRYESPGRYPIVVSDLDGDGTPDLAVGGNVFLNDGDGTFGGPEVYELSGFATLVAEDLNDDGNPDLAGTAESGVGVLLNTGDGTFEEPVLYELDGCYALLAADLNGDGSPDLAAAASANGPSVFVLLNTGNGSFEEPVGYETGGWGGPFSLCALDLNDDRRLDLAAVGRLQDPGRIMTVWGGVFGLLNRGDGTFGEPVYGEVEMGPPEFQPSDLNGDNKADFIVGRRVCEPEGCRNLWSVFLNRGDGGFEGPVDAGLGGAFDTVDSFEYVTADLNGDGKPDVLAGRGDRVFVLLGRGDGTFEEPVAYETGASRFGVFKLLSSDLDGDRAFDVVAWVVTGNGYRLVVLLNRGDGSFGEATHQEIPGEPADYQNPLLSADLNGDGRPELVAGTSRGILVFPNRGDGTFAEAAYASQEVVFSPVASDLNADGRLDLAARIWTGGGVLVLLNRGDGTFEERESYEPGPDFHEESVLAVADLNGDGSPDLVAPLGVCDPVCSIRIFVLLNRGDGTFETTVTHRVRALIPQSLLATDLDGDGSDDVILGTERGVFFLRSPGDGTFEDALVLEGTSTVYEPVSLFAFDFDEDGREDVALSAGGLWVLWNRTSEPLSTDVNRDGIPDECQTSFLRGDCNDDTAVDISDALCILTWLFLGGATPGCVAVTNTNGDAREDISDATYLLSHLFLGGPAPVAPYPACGPGTQPRDEETCEAPPRQCQ